jgi:hypothetical protein
MTNWNVSADGSMGQSRGPHRCIVLILGQSIQYLLPKKMVPLSIIWRLIIAAENPGKIEALER